MDTHQDRILEVTDRDDRASAMPLSKETLVRRSRDSCRCGELHGGSGDGGHDVLVAFEDEGALASLASLDRSHAVERTFPSEPDTA